MDSMINVLILADVSEAIFYPIIFTSLLNSMFVNLQNTFKMIVKVFVC